MKSKDILKKLHCYVSIILFCFSYLSYKEGLFASSNKTVTTH